MMKKFFAIVLALTLALTLSVAAFAAEINQDSDPKSGETTVKFGVDPSYTITIPATVELTPQTNDGTVTYEQEAKIVASKGVRLLNNQTIQVTLSAGEDGFVLTSKESAALDYTVTVDEKNIENGGVVATFGTSLEEQTSTLHFAAKDPAYAGDYSDTVTFTVSIESE